MRFLGLLYQHGLWIAPPAFALAVVLLIRVIADVSRGRERTTLARLPLAAAQPVRFDAPGDVILNIEGPIGTTRFSGALFALTAEDAATALKPSRVWFRLRSAGWRTARTEIERYHIPQAGVYTLRLGGMDTADDGRHAVVFTRPDTVAAVARVVAIVLLAGVAIGSLVLFALRASGRGN